MKNTLKTLYRIFIPYKRGIRATIRLYYGLLYIVALWGRKT